MPLALLWRRPWSRKLDKFFEAVGENCDFRKGREFRVREADFVPDTLTARLMALQGRIVEVVKRTEDEFLKAELQELGRRIRDARLGIATFLEQSAAQHVYWVERTGKAAQFLSLNASPIDIAPVLRRMIFRDDCCCVMTSATCPWAGLISLIFATGLARAKPNRCRSEVRLIFAGK